MRTPWIRNRPGAEENRRAAGIALGVGAAVGVAVFYFARILISRDPIEPRPGRGRSPERRPGGGEAE